MEILIEYILQRLAAFPEISSSFFFNIYLINN